MHIDSVKISSPDFRAKVFLNNDSILKSTFLHNQKTSLDTMFQETQLVKFLDNFSEFIKNNILCKYFDKPNNKFTKSLASVNYIILTSLRKLADRLFLLKNSKGLDKINETFSNIDISSPEYINELAKIGHGVKNKYVVANTEDGILKELTSTDEATIFLLNHPNYHKDKFVYAILNAMLSKLYALNGRQSSCPRPKILVSRNLLKVANEKVINIYKILGLTPVDASQIHKDKAYNSKSMKPLIKDFVQNKFNIFLFPEGNNSVYKNKPLEDKIQPGIVSLIRTVCSFKNRVRVVPIGINYTKEQNNLGKIYIGQPLYFDRTNFSSKTDNKRILEQICSKLKLCMEKSQTLQ